MANQPTHESDAIDSSSLLRTSSDLEHLLITEIETLLGDKCELQTRSSMLGLLNQLIFNLPILLELSLTAGYLSTVVEKRPSWSRQIDKLYQANLECVSSLELIRDWLEKSSVIEAIPNGLELRLRKWIESFSTMRCKESTMLQAAFTIDLGGEA